MPVPTRNSQTVNGFTVLGFSKTKNTVLCISPVCDTCCSFGTSEIVQHISKYGGELPSMKLLNEFKDQIDRILYYGNLSNWVVTRVNSSISSTQCFVSPDLSRVTIEHSFFQSGVVFTLKSLTDLINESITA